MSEFNIDDEFNIDEEFDSEYVGPNPLVVKLQQAFRTEVHAPTILPYEGELVEKIKKDLDELTNQYENFDDTMDDSGNTEMERVSMRFWRTLCLMDLERIRYSLTRYLRCRLKKIENSVEFFIKNVDARDRLSPQEETLLQKLNEIKNNHFKTVVFDKLTVPDHSFPNYRLENATPNEKEYVFARALKDVTGFPDEGNDVEIGMIIICQYSKVKEYVEKTIDDRSFELI